jgi:hypothetical protein
MARPARILKAHGGYHLTARGSGRRPILLDDKDRKHFCQLLDECVARFGLVMHAYALMDNRHYLLAETLRQPFNCPMFYRLFKTGQWQDVVETWASKTMPPEDQLSELMPFMSDAGAAFWRRELCFLEFMIALPPRKSLNEVSAQLPIAAWVEIDGINVTRYLAGFLPIFEKRRAGTTFASLPLKRQQHHYETSITFLLDGNISREAVHESLKGGDAGRRIQILDAGAYQFYGYADTHYLDRMWIHPRHEEHGPYEEEFKGRRRDIKAFLESKHLLDG